MTDLGLRKQSNCAGVLPTVSTPSAASGPATSADFAVFEKRSLKRLTTATGVADPVTNDNVATCRRTSHHGTPDEDSFASGNAASSRRNHHVTAAVLTRHDSTARQPKCVAM